MGSRGLPMWGCHALERVPYEGGGEGYGREDSRSVYVPGASPDCWGRPYVGGI